MGQAGEEYNADAAALIRRHLAIGWATLLVFLSLGMVLEVFHGFKVRWYVDLNNATRRLMWTLAHAHGVLIGLIHISFAATVHFSIVIPNFSLLEYNWDVRDQPEDLFPTAMHIQADRFPLPTAPGLGVEFNEDAAPDYPFEYWEAPHWRRRDDSYTNW